MYSKIVARLRMRWSLLAWLTVWYTSLSIALIAGATAFSYWVLVSNLEREDNEFVRSRLNDVESRLQSDDVVAVSSTWATASDEPSPLRILIRVLHDSGMVLAETKGSNEVPWQSISKTDSLDGEDPSGQWYYATRKTALPSGQPVVIQAALDRRQESQFLSRYRKQLLLVMFIAAVASAIGGIVLARRGLRPLVELSSVAERIEASQMGERLRPSEYATELAAVAKTFNVMLDRLQGSIQRLQQFSGDIAHELRSPLHNLRGEVEVALSKERSGDDYRNTLGSCLEETVRLSRLVESLLFLAKSDRPQSALVTESLVLSEQLQTIKEFYEAAAEEAGIQLIIDSKAGLVIRADRSLFQRVIGNLITNALTHTPKGGWVRVFAEWDSSMVEITVSDSGFGIQADQLPHVFDRLFRGSDCRPNNGHGLGLAIVKSTVELHGGKVTISSVLGKGTAVRIHWPP